MKRIIISLSVVSLFAYAEEQQINAITEPEAVIQPQSDWDDAKRSSQQALEDIWSASKETTQELVEDGSEKSQQVWQSSKEKSSELWEKGKQNSKDVWQDLESGSKEAWSEGKEKVEQLLEEDEDPTIKYDEI